MTMKWELESVLEQSLTQIATGKARVESCLLAYPTMADELEPLLRTAETLRTLPRPVLASEARARIEDQLLDAVVANPRLVPARRPRPRLTLPQWRVPRWALNALTLVLALLVTMTAVVGASADALPDSALYPVKLATEDVWLWLAPAGSEPRLHLHLARRRLAEIEAMAVEDNFEAAVLEDMATHIEASLVGASDLPPALALPLLDELTTFLNEERETLTALVASAPADSRGFLESALLESAGFISRAESLRSSLKANGTPGAPLPTGSHTPTGLPGMTGVEEPTGTPAFTGAGAAVGTPTSTATPGPAATLEPTSEQRQPAPTGTDPAASGPGTASQPTDTPEGPPAWGLTREPGEPTVPARGLTTRTPKPKDDSKDKDKDTKP